MAVAVAVTLAPQLVVSVGRVRAARRLRGRPGGLRGVRGTVMPVLEEALERSVRLAASMDVRGYGRTEVVTPAAPHRPRGALLVGLAGLVVGSFALLDGSAPAVLRPRRCWRVGAASLAGRPGAGRAPHPPHRVPPRPVAGCRSGSCQRLRGQRRGGVHGCWPTARGRS